MDDFNHLCLTLVHKGFEDKEVENQKSDITKAEGEESFKERLVNSIKCHTELKYDND